MKKKNKTDYLMILLIIIFCIVLYCYIQLAVQKQKYVNFCGYTFFRVISGSMANTIQINDIVIVKLTKEINENDIITYYDGNNYVTHRIISIDDKKIITQGDANNTPDEPIKKEDVLGKVTTIIPVAISIKVFTSKEVIGAIILTIFGLWVLFKKPGSQITISKEEKND